MPHLVQVCLTPWMFIMWRLMQESFLSLRPQIEQVNSFSSVWVSLWSYKNAREVTRSGPRDGVRTPLNPALTLRLQVVKNLRPHTSQACFQVVLSCRRLCRWRAPLVLLMWGHRSHGYVASCEC